MTDEHMYLDAMQRNITTEKIFGYVKQLSDPASEGRLAGSPGMAKAVDIVKGYFKETNAIGIAIAAATGRAAVPRTAAPLKPPAAAPAALPAATLAA